MRARVNTALVLLTLGVFLVRVCPSSADDRSASFGGGHPNDSAEDDDFRDRGVHGASLDAPCSPEAPCVHLVPHTHLDPGWRDTFEGYHRAFASRIHPSVVLALAADHRKRFAFADVSFLARWLEETGETHVPPTCAYDPKPPPLRDGSTLDAAWRREGVRSAKAEKTACPPTWSAMCRRLVREGRLDVVGGGWVSHDEATTPVDLAAAQYDEGMATVEALLFSKESAEERGARDGDARGDGDANAIKIAWQIDPFGHAAATPAVLAHLGFERVVLNRVSRTTRARLIRENAREFTWSSTRREEREEDDEARGGSAAGSVAAHVLRAHYNVPPELDFERRRIVTNADGSLRADLVDRAAAALLETARAASQGVTHGHAFVLVGDDFRFADASATFDAWRDVLHRVSSAYGTRERGGPRETWPRRASATRSSFGFLDASSPPLRFRWSTPREYFASLANSSRPARGKTKTRVFGAFFPYADNFPASENAWVGGYVARRALKDAVLQAATGAVVASSFAASLPPARRSAAAEAALAAARRDVRAARRDGFLGLHHDAITGTCPAHVAEDYFVIAKRAETASRRVIRAAASVALECDELEPRGDANTDASDVPFLARAGDAFAVYNPRGDVASAAQVTVRIARGLVLVDARDRLLGSGQVPLPTQSAFGFKVPGKVDARDDTFAVVVADAPPLGAAVVVAIERASLDRVASVDPSLDPSLGSIEIGASEHDKHGEHGSVRPEDVGVSFDAKGATIQFPAGPAGPNQKKVFARLSAASVAFPRDEHFGDGPYVSRSAAAHVFVVWVASVLGYVVGDVGVGAVLTAACRAVKTSRDRDGVFAFAKRATGKRRRRFRENGDWMRSCFVSLAASARRRARDFRDFTRLSSRRSTFSFVGLFAKSFSTSSRTPARRGLRFDDKSFVVSDDDDDDAKKEPNTNSRVPHHETRFASDETRLAFAFAAGAAFPLVVWSPGIVSHAAYRALLDKGLKRTGAFLKLGVPFGAVTRGVIAFARVPRREKPSRDAMGIPCARGVCVSFARAAGAYLSLATAATCGFLLVATSAPWLDARPLLAPAGAEPVCRRGAVFSECAFAYGGGVGGGGDDAPSALLVVRDVFADGGAQRRVEWVATAPLDSEIVARVAWREGTEGTDLTIGSLRVDDGVGGFATTRKPRILDAFRKGWSVAARSVPSGRFVEFVSLGASSDEPRRGSEPSSEKRGRSRFGLVFERGGTSVFLAPTFASFGVHRNALSDDGHGLGAHGAGARDLSDARPGRLAFRLIVPTDSTADDATDDMRMSSLRRIAAVVARPPVAVRVPRGCARTSWSPFAASAPAETRVLQTDADGAADSCALRFRVQNVGSGAMTADGLARAVGGDVAMDPPTVPPGGLAHARWDRAC